MMDVRRIVLLALSLRFLNLVLPILFIDSGFAVDVVFVIFDVD